MSSQVTEEEVRRVEAIVDSGSDVREVLVSLALIVPCWVLLVFLFMKVIHAA
jgi:hypothetical protein